MSIITGLNKGMLMEVSNFKLFTVYHTLSMETKRIIFIEEFKRNTLSLSQGAKEKIDYLNNLLGNNQVIYDEIIKKLSSVEIKEFSNQLVTKLLKEYEYNQPNILSKLTQYITVENVIIIVIIGTVIVGGIYLFKNIDMEKIKELAQKTKEIVQTNKDHVDITKSNAENMSTLATAIKTLAEDMSLILDKVNFLEEKVNLQSDSIKTTHGTVEKLSLVVLKTYGFT